jgi:hypothetical protein
VLVSSRSGSSAQWILEAEHDGLRLGELLDEAGSPGDLLRRALAVGASSTPRRAEVGDGLVLAMDLSFSNASSSGRRRRCRRPS